MRHLLPVYLFFFGAALSAQTMYVSAESGLYLRARPDRTAPALLLVPFRSPVEYIKRVGNEMSIDGARGFWVLAKAGTVEGYCFGAFISNYRPVLRTEIPGIFITPDDGKYMPSRLALRSDGSFLMSANSCHGFVPISGHWTLITDPEGRGQFVHLAIDRIADQNADLGSFRPRLHVETLDQLELFPVQGTPVACDFRDFEVFDRSK